MKNAVGASISTLKFVHEWFVAPKNLKDLENAVSFNDDIDLDINDIDIVRFFNNSTNNFTCSNVIRLIDTNVNNINLGIIILLQLIA